MICRNGCFKDQDNLKLNDGKTELLITGSKQQLQKLDLCRVCAMSCHITKTCGAAFYWLITSIKRINKFLSREKLLNVIHAFITNRLNYCYALMTAYNVKVPLG